MIKTMVRSGLRTMLLCSAATSGAAFAQTDAPPQEQGSSAGQLEEIVVTAQKREQNMQDVGIAMTALSGDQLSDRAIGNTDDLSSAISGLQTYNYAGGGSPQFFVRGIGTADFAQNTPPTNPLYVDEIYLSSSVVSGISLFDIEGVEVLKGPQGTLFGRNTIGGAISFRTRRPTEFFEGYVKATAGSYETVGIEGAVGGPISDGLRFRIAGKAKNQGRGYYKNVDVAANQALNFPEVTGDSFYNGNVLTRGARNNEYAIRGSLDFDLGSRGSVLASATYAEANGLSTPLNTLGQIGPDCAFGADPENGVFDKTKCSTFGYVDPLKKFEASNSYIGRQDRQGTSLLLRGEYDLGGVQLTSITGYMDGSQTLGTDTDGTPIRLGEKIRSYKVEALSSELRFTDTSKDGFFWMAGGYISTDKNSLVDAAEFTRSLGFLRNTNIPGYDWSATRVIANQHTDTWALFAHTETALTEQLNLIAGLRYTHIDKRFSNSTNAIYSAADAAAIRAQFGSQVLDGRVPDSALANIDGSGPGLIDDGRKDERLTWKIGLDWKIQPDLLLYTSYSRGFREGGFEGNFVLSANNATGYGDETLDAIELGWKSELFDRTLRFNGSVYYYKYSDAQQRTTAINPNNNIPANFIANIGDARQYGVDLDASWVVSDFLTLDAGLNWLDQSIKADANILQIEDGEVFPYASKFSATLNASVEVPVNSRVDFRLQGGLKYASSFETTAENLRALRDDGYTLLNARVGIADHDDKWQLSIFGNNLTNAFYTTQAYALFASYVIGGNTPRTYGISFEYKF